MVAPEWEDLPDMRSKRLMHGNSPQPYVCVQCSSIAAVGRLCAWCVVRVLCAHRARAHQADGCGVRAGLTALDHKIFAIGGLKDSSNPKDSALKSGEVLDLTQDKLRWDPLPYMETERVHHGLAGYKHQLYAIGGSTGLVMNTSEVLDLKTMKWKALPEMTSPRMDLGTVNGHDLRRLPDERSVSL